MKYMTCVLATLLLTATAAMAAKPVPLSCVINNNDPVSVNAGDSVDFQGVVSGGDAPYNVTWTFEGGAPANAIEVVANSGDQTTLQNVTYAAAGSFTTTMDVADSGNGQGKTCSASVTVNVTVAGNNPPIAQNDDYNTAQDVTLNVAAPDGVLFNDTDPNGDPLTAVLASNVTDGVLNLAADGSFSYAPDAGFSGQDSFTYTAEDGNGPSSNVATVTIGVTPANEEVSINSTSANRASVPGSAVSELDLSLYLPNSDYAIVAINDLGMHCGDLDTRISSILPPFNVLHAQVILRGNGGLPRILVPSEVPGEGDDVEVFYSAASNPNDPAPSRVVGGQALSSVAADGTVYKTNFWDTVLQGAYDPFYPYQDPFGVIPVPLTPLAGPPFNVTTDVGLPMPDTTLLYLGPDGVPGSSDEALEASQQFMPGILNPYTDNVPQVFHEHIGTLPFFINFPFGYTADVNLFEAAGVPIAAFDDFGRENPYPLVKVHAEVASTPVAAIDIVMPISGEAECQSCHSADVGTGDAIVNLAPANQAAAMDDPLSQGVSSVPFEVSVEWASDINILSLHDQKHGTTLNSGFDANTGQGTNPVVCQTCHYTPALDLAQLGPLEGPAGTLANGRDQVKHKSMSNVMHSHHDSTGLFPPMPPAIDAQGNRRDPVLTQTILEETCYLCHPGKRTQCMRGAMANGGLVCQDCHGQMQDVGDDFTRNVTLANDGSQFELGPDFYDPNSNTPRVPWANEPGCGSCHTGYATDNLAADPNVLVSPTDTLGNADGIRLLSAYRQNDAKATPIVPVNKAFAENVVTVDDLPGDPGAIGNPKLYRVSNGHGGLMCEACHGSTHAEWPTANPNANDNVPATQLQGHSGYIAECTVCHEPNDASLPMGNNGPHGMHAVVDLDPVGPAKVDDRWNFVHRNFKNDAPGCESCHGDNLEGTVLSRTADDRTVHCKDNKGSLPGCAAGDPTAIIPKGTPVGCGMCHRQK